MSVPENSPGHGDAGFDAAVARMKRTSRAAGVLTLAGAAVALTAMGLSAWQVVELQDRVAALHVEEAAATQRIRTLRSLVQAEEDKRELARAQLQQDNTAAAAQILGSPAVPSSVLAPPADSRTATSRVYFQIRSRDDNRRYAACASALRTQGYRVPQYEVVSSGPASTQVRYFHSEEKAKAEALAQATRDCLGGAPVQLVFLGRYQGVNPNHFEVWLAPPTAAS